MFDVVQNFSKDINDVDIDQIHHSQVPISGWLVIDKPLNMTSAQAVGIIKRKLRHVVGVKVKIGHTGTLDPLATGILPLALGEATKLSQIFLDSCKTYSFTIAWGSKTDTADSAGNIISTSDHVPTQQQIEAIIPQFLNAQEQIPPKYSALKVNGKRAYDLARQEVDFTLKKRSIYVHNLELISHDDILKQSHFTITCSKGTYVRTIGEDIAQACQTYGHLGALRRTKVGFFSQEHAILPDICQNLVYKSILGITQPLDGISAINLCASQEKLLRFGQKIPWSGFVPDAQIFPAYNEYRQLVALVSVMDGLVIPKRIFNL